MNFLASLKGGRGKLIGFFLLIAVALQIDFGDFSNNYNAPKPKAAVAESETDTEETELVAEPAQPVVQSVVQPVVQPAVTQPLPQPVQPVLPPIEPFVVTNDGVD